ncbi:hypothetical protein [Amaricoccus macauensis]|uniref:hypothetical protein n=1 Tax=Amaricoccus macauensis TaxID=57001 RepID=UPI003C7A084D
MKNVTLAILLGTLLPIVGATDPSAQTRCRTNTLGSQNCLEGGSLRPLARPPELLERQEPRGVIREGAESQSGPTIIPARNVDKLGTTLPSRSTGVNGARCRSDSLGNMVCR